MLLLGEHAIPTPWVWTETRMALRVPNARSVFGSVGQTRGKPAAAKVNAPSFQLPSSRPPWGVEGYAQGWMTRLTLFLPVAAGCAQEGAQSTGGRGEPIRDGEDGDKRPHDSNHKFKSLITLVISEATT